MVIDREPLLVPDARAGPAFDDKRIAFATVAVRGRIDRPRPFPHRRASLFAKIISALTARTDWADLAAVLLPGGFVRLRKPIGPLDDAQRRSALLATKAAGLCREASRRLEEWSPGALLVIGIDTDPASKNVGGDQLVTAWQAGELVGLARKTFPADGDTNGEQPPYPLFRFDFASPSRIVTLRSGHRVLLLGCYDAFGTRSLVHSRFADLAAMRLARDEHGNLNQPTLAHRHHYLFRWRALIRAHPPDLGLCAIHGFKRPGMDGYWQRHGIAGASAALGGIPVIGAAHFNKALPVSIDRSVLAASGVPLSHLELGPHRPMQALAPQEGFTVADDDCRPVALIRRFHLALRANHKRNI